MASLIKPFLASMLKLIFIFIGVYIYLIDWFSFLYV